MKNNLKDKQHMWTKEKVKWLRNLYGETQEEFCKRLEVSVQTLRYWEQHDGAPGGPARAVLTMLKNEIEGRKKSTVPA